MNIAIIPTLNEEKNIAWVLDRVIKIADRVIIVDGLSSDNTINVAKKFRKMTILLEGNSGKGNALRRGFEVALKYRPKYVIMLDGDGEKDPNDIPKMIRWLEKNDTDMAVGFRAQKRSFERGFFNFFASWWIRFVTGYKIRDCLSGFNIIKAESLNKMNLISRNFEIETELILEARKNNMEVIEYPVSSPMKSPSKLKKLHMKEINNFFDKWTLDWIDSQDCNIPFYKKIFLKFFCRLGLLIFR